MTPNDRDRMERYIYQVVRRLPKNQRQEVGLELQELIGDMLEEAASMDEVLLKLGDPVLFANKYRDDAHCLIGPAYYDTYVWFLKIVLLCTAIPVVAVAVIEGFAGRFAMAPSDVETLYISAMVTTAIQVIARALGNAIASCVGAFGGVTLVFAILERMQIKIDLKREKAWTVENLGERRAQGLRVWSPDDLQPVPTKKAVISRGDSIVGIVFLVILTVLLILAPHFFSAIFHEDSGVVIIPLFNLEQWSVILPLLVVSLIVNLADEIVRLVAGCYCRLVMISRLVSGGLQMLLSVIVLKVLPFWNPAFATELADQMGSETVGMAQFVSYWGTGLFTDVLLAIILVATLAEMGTTVYKTLRYGVDRPVPVV